MMFFLPEFYCTEDALLLFPTGITFQTVTLLNGDVPVDVTVSMN